MWPFVVEDEALLEMVEQLNTSTQKAIKTIIDKVISIDTFISLALWSDTEILKYMKKLEILKNFWLILVYKKSSSMVMT